MELDIKNKAEYWIPNIDENLRERVLNVVLEISEKLKDKNFIEQTVMHPNNKSLAGNIYPWDPVTLSHGYPGIIILFAELDKLFPNNGWDIASHNHLIEIQHYMKNHGINNFSLFGGIAGIAYSVLYASRNGTRYNNFLNNTNKWLISQVNLMLNECQIQNTGTSPSVYDNIQGLSGVGRYLLEIKNDQGAIEALKGIISLFINMTKDISVYGEKVPGWYVSNENQFLEKDKSDFPKGNFNCGLAHGITGPLALMSLALKNGIEINGQREAMQFIVDWIKNWYTDDYWPDRLSFEEVTEGKLYHTYSKRKGWCYGNPGVTRALFLAGQALDNDDITNLVLREYSIVNEEIAKHKSEQWELYSPSFCHGKAGFLQIYIRLYKDISDDNNSSINYLLNFLLESYRPDTPFGFKDIEQKNEFFLEKDKVGLLEGVSGILLVLLSLCVKEEPWWDGVFLIS